MTAMTSIPWAIRLIFCLAIYQISELIPIPIRHSGFLSLNAGSLSAKFNSLPILLDSLSYQNIRFPVICIQESWISDELIVQLFQLDGYNTFHVNATASTHGGVVTYVDNTYDATIKAQVNNSDIWDGLF